MHISEGILTLPVIFSGWGCSALLATLALRHTSTQQLPRIAVLSSAFFLASLVRIPLGASSIHFTLLGVMGIILGWSAFPAIFIALALQAILFQFGGLLSLGVNASVMGGAALLGCLPLTPGLRRPGRLASGIAFLCGALPIVIAAVLIYLALTWSHATLASTATLLFIANLPLALLEGGITLFAFLFLKRVAPELLTGSFR
ncbi:cobalt transporter CbiM [Edwardsiella ictaluri]|uniref:Cobalamin biosynthesis protein CbiM n=3 Tax=Edwardsiella ictaluri TaxID=67780 RepID=C5BCI5_EDWI9|nr:cobalt transporter CbiM [Edwardsiella ictaluri]ACR68279.1 hypothetical protein NT01EI_1067 [Edwardsiella ictaluri 93-146]AVZ81353.1 cobalt transporter CbiM [Edwardsiella ictaluri]EKS7762585.1 cobalt transporter CbiM [Edwardsiella ictaluri]EKS7769287.1 cobalt transporter CbiM [Edwardsiella ictaluri]EKS7772436.1 cobalt transporter CbiM [Edwardsiella ictaluri]